MPKPHEPRLEIDETVVVNVGITPLGVYVVGHIVLDDAHHILRLQHVTVLEVAHAAYFVTYPIPVAITVKELLVDSCCQAITCKFEQLNRFFLRFIQFLLHTMIYEPHLSHEALDFDYSTSSQSSANTSDILGTHESARPVLPL